MISRLNTQHGPDLRLRHCGQQTLMTVCLRGIRGRPILAFYRARNLLHPTGYQLYGFGSARSRCFQLAHQTTLVNERWDPWYLGAYVFFHQIVHYFERDEPDNKCTKPLQKAERVATDNRFPGGETPQVR